MDLAPDGDAVVLGYFANEVDFIGRRLSPSGEDDVFVLRLDSASTREWVTRLGDGSGDRATAVAVGPDGRVYVAGRSNRHTVVNNVMAGAVYLAAVDAADGSALWRKEWGGNGISSRGLTVVPTQRGPRVGARTDEQLTVGDTTIAPESGSVEGFVAGLDSSGSPQWARSVGPISDMTGVGSDAAVHLLGSFNETAVDFGGGPLESLGSQDAFVATLDLQGDHVASTSLGGPDRDAIQDAALGLDGTVYAVGMFGGFDPWLAEFTKSP